MLEMIDGTRMAKETQKVIMWTTANNEKNRNLFNNAAQVWNHSFFWSCMTPDGGGGPAGVLASKLESAFGGVDAFKQAFAEAAVDQFGSGWMWLVLDGDSLKVVNTHDALNPLVLNQTPLLTCNLWEHAFYLDYENRRQEFVESFLDGLVEWSFVQRQLDPETRMAA